MPARSILIRLSRSILLCSLLCAAGCTTYEYNIVQPPDLRRQIGHDRDVVLNAGPLKYRMRAVEDRLVVRIYNVSRDTLRLLGDQSAIITPDGQSLPMRGRMLPAGSYMKLILPPMPKVEPRGGFQIGLGFGVASGYAGPELGGYYGPAWDQPQYVAVYDDPPWQWPVNQDVRVILAYQGAGQNTVTQEWVFRKVKK